MYTVCCIGNCNKLLAIGNLYLGARAICNRQDVVCYAQQPISNTLNIYIYIYIFIQEHTTNTEMTNVTHASDTIVAIS